MISDISFQPDSLCYLGRCVVAEAPHLVEKIIGKADLHALRFNTVVEQRKQIGNGLIGTIGCLAESKLFIRFGLLRGLIDQVMHILFQKSNDMAGHVNRRLLHGALSDFSRAGARSCHATSRLTVLRPLLYDDGQDRPHGLPILARTDRFLLRYEYTSDRAV